MRHISLPCDDINHDHVIGVTFHVWVLGGTYFMLVWWVGTFRTGEVGGTYLALIVCVGLI